MDGAQPVSHKLLLENAFWMRRLAQGLIRNSVQADDITQQAFAVALEKPPQRTDKLRGWLRTVIKHLVFRNRREEARRKRREYRAARPEAVSAAPARTIEQLELHRLITDLVFGLPDPYRSTVFLRYYEDLAPRDIAELEGVAEATVRSRLQRAMEKLRAALDQKHADGRTAWMSALIPLAFPQGLRAGVLAQLSGQAAGGGGSISLTAATTGGVLMADKSLLALVMVVMLLIGGGLGLWYLSGPRPGTLPQAPAANLDKVQGELAALRKERDALAKENLRLKSTLEALRKKSPPAGAAGIAPPVDKEEAPLPAGNDGIAFGELADLIATSLPILALRYPDAGMTDEQSAVLEQLIGEIIKVNAAARAKYAEPLLTPAFFRQFIPALLETPLKLGEGQKAFLRQLVNNMAESLPEDVASFTPMEKNLLRRAILDDLYRNMYGEIREEQRRDWDSLHGYLEGILCSKSEVVASLSDTNADLMKNLAMNAYHGILQRGPVEPLREMADDYLNRVREVVGEYGLDDEAMEALTVAQKDRLDGRLLKLQVEFERKILPLLDEELRAAFLRQKPLNFRFRYKKGMVYQGTTLFF